jgi:hypothetical protein
MATTRRSRPYVVDPPCLTELFIGSLVIEVRGRLPSQVADREWPHRIICCAGGVDEFEKRPIAASLPDYVANTLQRFGDFRITRRAPQPHIYIAFTGRESVDGAFSADIFGRQPTSNSVLTGTL